MTFNSAGPFQEPGLFSRPLPAPPGAVDVPTRQVSRLPANSAACRHFGPTWQELSVDVRGRPADTFGWVVLIRAKRKTMSLGARVGAMSSD